MYDPSGLYKWPQDGPGQPVTVTFSFANLLDGQLGGQMTPADVSRAVAQALSLWASVAPLNFVELPDSGPEMNGAYYPAWDAWGNRYPDIRLGHRDMGEVLLAKSWGPFSTAQGLYGDILFDTDRNWAFHPDQGFDLLYTAAHEIGHALGLDHSNTSPSIMRASYQAVFGGPGSGFLYEDDIAGIRALYGAGTGSVTLLQYTGDFNGDRVVDQEDLNLLLSHWAATSPPAGWYGPFDGNIDQNELTDILAGWTNSQIAPQILISPIPAPSALLALLAGQTLLARRTLTSRQAADGT